MKLISMTDFVLDTKQNLEIGKDFVEVICNYANFLKQPLKLEMFVPCDEDGNVLIEPKFYYREEDLKHLKGVELQVANRVNEKRNQYQQAKEKVLFDGFEVCNRTSNIDCVNYKEDHLSLKLLKGKTIEYLINRNLTLTPSAIKQFNL